MRFIPVNILETKGYSGHMKSDCSNNGISNQHNQVFIAHEKGWIAPEHAPEDQRVEIKHWMGNMLLKPTDLNGHSMFGGRFAWSSDSRFRAVSQAPLPIHDRVEN